MRCQGLVVGTALVALAGCASPPAWPGDIEKFSPQVVQAHLAGMDGMESAEAIEVVMDDEIRWYARICFDEDITDEQRAQVRATLEEAEEFQTEHAEATGAPSEYWSLLTIECGDRFPG